jgi:NADPH-dependent glutamate synthase beta subunit-like oxidoreductase/ferredoxin
VTKTVYFPVDPVMLAPNVGSARSPGSGRGKSMKPTDTSNPDYFHKVVDCQWACPAHTDVPLYIRLIAQGRFGDAYIENRKSNVFPGIHREDITDRLPKGAAKTNGKKVALIGCGCASLTVANDLRPLGYEVTIFEALDTTGGLMRTNIPRFRLPPEVLDEEIKYIVDMGVDLKLNHRIESMKELLDSGEFDAVFVGTGAPRGKNLEIPGRYDSDRIHIGIDWLESVAFEHIEEIGKRVLIIGVGNTAMDCCRTSLRLGATDVKVMARKPRGFFKASDWELEDAEEENVEILVNHSPKEFVIEDGKLVGMTFELMEYAVGEDGRIDRGTVLGEKTIACDDVILAIGQDNAFPWIERDIGIEFNEWDCPVVDETTMMCTREGVFFGGDSAFGPKNIIWAVAHGHEAAISIHKYCEGKDIGQRMPRGINLLSQKMGMHEWSYSNYFDPAERRIMPHVELKERFKKLDIEVELGFTVEQTIQEVERCLNCDIQTVFAAKLCIECDACIDICPVKCLTITHNGEEADLRSRLSAPAENRALSDRCVGHAEITGLDSVRRGRRIRSPAEESRRKRCLSRGLSSGWNQRYRHQDCHGERYRFGKRKRPVAKSHFPHGCTRRWQELFPVEYPGTAHLVRDTGNEGWLPVALRSRRHHGSDECPDLCPGSGGSCAGWMAGLRLNLAAQQAAGAAGHHGHRRAAVTTV